MDLGAVDLAAALDEYSTDKVYTYKELTKDGWQEKLGGVDPTAREQHLSDEEFQKHFKMDKAAFNLLPKWKKLGAKKAAKLF